MEIVGKNKVKITGGVYLVADPHMPEEELIKKIGQALKGGVSILQITDSWPDSLNDCEKARLISRILTLADAYGIPVLINENWRLAEDRDLHGVHFNKVPDNFDEIKALLDDDMMFGITCGNDLEVVHWAQEQQLDYVSFWPMLPSGPTGTCELVKPETVTKARDISDMPFFLSGGITIDNIQQFHNLNFNGVALISGILSAPAPKTITADFKKTLNKLM